MSGIEGSDSDDREHDSGGTVHTTFHDWSGDDSLWVTLVRAAAAVSGKEPTTIQPLAEVVDPDALENFFVSGSADAPRTERTVSFVFIDLDVTVHSSGQIVVESHE